eukprot:scaffold16553_cov70-Phaeocystis_antarctica.AAC.1
MSRSGRPGGECWPWGLPMSWCARIWAGRARDGSANENDFICNSRSEKAVAAWLLGGGCSVMTVRIDRGKEFWSVQADIAVRTEKNRTVMHGDDTSLVWFRGIATPIRMQCIRGN